MPLGLFHLFFVLWHHGVHDGNVQAVLSGQGFDRLFLQRSDLLVGFKVILLSLPIGAISPEPFELSKQYPDDLILLVCDGAAWYKSKSLICPPGTKLLRKVTQAGNPPHKAEIWDSMGLSCFWEM